MTIQALIAEETGRKLSEQHDKAKADAKLAASKRSELEAFIAETFPRTWKHIKDCITGACVVRFTEKTGGSEEGEIALIVEDKWMLYQYRNSAYQQITVRAYMGGGEICQDNHSEWYSSFAFGTKVKSEDLEQNDRNLIEVFERAIARNAV
jgi:hypothetical protein